MVIKVSESEKINIDYNRIDQLVENSSKMFPDIDKYILFILAMDYHLKEELKVESDDTENKEVNEMFNRCKQELETKIYDNIKVA